MRRHLPIFDETCLDTIGIAKPCNASWAHMRGDARVRHCTDCRLNVYNVSEMTRREAAALIAAHEGHVCVRLFRRSDGTLITQDCWERLRAARRRGLAAFVVALAIVCITQLGLRVVAVRALLDWYGSSTVSMGAPVQRPQQPSVQPPAPPVPVMGEVVAPPHANTEPPTPESKGKIALPPHAQRHPKGPVTRPVAAHDEHVRMGKLVAEPELIMGELTF